MTFSMSLLLKNRSWSSSDLKRVLLRGTSNRLLGFWLKWGGGITKKNEKKNLECLKHPRWPAGRRLGLQGLGARTREWWWPHITSTKGRHQVGDGRPSSSRQLTPVTTPSFLLSSFFIHTSTNPKNPCDFLSLKPLPSSTSTLKSTTLPLKVSLFSTIFFTLFTFSYLFSQ